jgi:hypothetical protein
MVKSLLHIPKKQARKACQAGTTPFRASKAPLTIAESSDNMTVKNNPVRIPMTAGSCIFKRAYEIKVEFNSKTGDAKIQQKKADHPEIRRSITPRLVYK